MLHVGVQLFPFGEMRLAPTMTACESLKGLLRGDLQAECPTLAQRIDLRIKKRFQFFRFALLLSHFLCMLLLLRMNSLLERLCGLFDTVGEVLACKPFLFRRVNPKLL